MKSSLRRNEAEEIVTSEGYRIRKTHRYAIVSIEVNLKLPACHLLISFDTLQFRLMKAVV